MIALIINPIFNRKNGSMPVRSGFVNKKFQAIATKKVLIDPDSLLLEPFFHVVHFRIKNFVIVILLEPADMLG